MAFNDDYGSPQQPALVTATLEVFCKEAGIEPDSYEHDVARDLIRTLYSDGARTSELIVAAIGTCFDTARNAIRPQRGSIRPFQMERRVLVGP